MRPALRGSRARRVRASCDYAPNEARDVHRQPPNTVNFDLDAVAIPDRDVMIHCLDEAFADVVAVGAG